MIATLVLACAPIQDARAPDAAFYDALIRKTNECQAFVAEYSVQITGEEQARRIRVSYRAPDEMRVDMVGSALFQASGGILELRASSPEGPRSKASVPLVEMMAERRSRITKSIRSELPAIDDWPDAADCGIVLYLDVASKDPETIENFQFGVKNACPRTAVLGWLRDFKERDDVRFDGDDHLLARTPGGAELRLSAKTGFLESIEKEKNGKRLTFRLASLDLAPKFEATAFALPEAAKDAVDASSALASQLHESITRDLRRELLRSIGRHVADKSLEWPAARAHARKALEDLHADGIATESERTIADMRKGIEGIQGPLSARYAAVGKGSGDERAALETQVEEQRKKLIDGFRKRFEARLSRMSIDERAVPDAALRKDLEETERAAFDAAFARVLQDPLVKEFDDQVARAKAGG